MLKAQVSIRLNRQRYVLLPLCRGSASQIYRAVPERGENGSMGELAVKVLRRNMIRSTAIRERFRIEARLLNQLSHPGIPERLIKGRLGKRPFLAYHYIPGASLLEILKHAFYTQGIVPWVACELQRQILETLTYLHGQKRPIVHSDISPENLLLDPQSRVHLIDFGSAQILEKKNGLASRWIGKPSYLSPEQARGLPWDTRSDLYQTGILFFELLTGRKFNTGLGLLEARALAANPPIVDYAGVPHALRPVLNGLLAVHPDRRWPDSKTCLHALEQVIAFGALFKDQKMLEKRS